jgi:uncharacterized protein (DUF952 family)
MMSEHIYKILPAAEWTQAQSAGVFAGSTVDHADGYIHFSTATQARETAAKHFAGKTGLLLLTVDPARCTDADWRWEPSRGGALFPHLYGSLDLACVIAVDDLPLDGDAHRFPDAVT